MSQSRICECIAACLRPVHQRINMFGHAQPILCIWPVPRFLIGFSENHQSKGVFSVSIPNGQAGLQACDFSANKILQLVQMFIHFGMFPASIKKHYIRNILATLKKHEQHGRAVLCRRKAKPHWSRTLPCLQRNAENRIKFNIYAALNGPVIVLTVLRHEFAHIKIDEAGFPDQAAAMRQGKG